MGLVYLSNTCQSFFSWDLYQTYILLLFITLIYYMYIVFLAIRFQLLNVAVIKRQITQPGADSVSGMKNHPFPLKYLYDIYTVLIISCILKLISIKCTLFSLTFLPSSDLPRLHPIKSCWFSTTLLFLGESAHWQI